MAVLDITANSPHKGITERGQHAWRQWQVDSTSTAALYCVMDMMNVGGLSIAFFVNNLNTLGAPYGQVQQAIDLEVSNDNENWTAVAWKDDDGTETTSSGKNVAPNASEHVIVNFGSYPEQAGFRWFRLKLVPASGTTNRTIVSCTVK